MSLFFKNQLIKPKYMCLKSDLAQKGRSQVKIKCLLGETLS